MSALGEFVKAVARQYDLLEYASSMDDATLCATRPEGDFGRHWTRQDARRLRYERETEELEAECERERCAVEQSGQPVPNRLLWPKTSEVEGRRDTRVARILRRWPSPDHRPALAEAKKEGTYSVLAPLVIALSEAHRLLRRHYAGKSFDETWDGYSTPIEEFERVEGQHSKALALLVPHLLDVSPEDVRIHRRAAVERRKVASGNESRDKWIYNECIKGTAYKAIIHQLRNRERWDKISTAQGIQQAAERYAERNSLDPPPRRKDSTC